jgi:FkbM family methyltransferase
MVRAVENPLALLRVRILGGRGELRFINGFRLPVSRANIELAARLVRLAYYGADLADGVDGGASGFRVGLEADEIRTPGGLRFRLHNLEPFTFAEAFVYDVHFRGFDLSEKVVVDAGAFLGESALYFAQQGARVLAFEPDPVNFAGLQQNLELNRPLSDRIQAFPAAVGTDGEVNFHFGLEGGSGIYASAGKIMTVPSVSLRTILEQNQLRSAYLLKADCKGTEFELTSQPEIDRFELLSIEYSADLRHRRVETLVEQLRARGFRRIRVFKHHWNFFPLQEHGMLQAEH